MYSGSSDWTIHTKNVKLHGLCMYCSVRTTTIQTRRCLCSMLSLWVVVFDMVPLNRFWRGLNLIKSGKDFHQFFIVFSEFFSNFPIHEIKSPQKIVFWSFAKLNPRQNFKVFSFWYFFIIQLFRWRIAYPYDNIIKVCLIRLSIKNMYNWIEIQVRAPENWNHAPK